MRERPDTQAERFRREWWLLAGLWLALGALIAVVLSLERRLDLLAGVEASGGWLIEDDYDSDFNHAQPGARPLPAIQGLRPEAPVIYVGTFSKLL